MGATTSLILDPGAIALHRVEGGEASAIAAVKQVGPNEEGALAEEEDDDEESEEEEDEGGEDEEDEDEENDDRNTTSIVVIYMP